MTFCFGHEIPRPDKLTDWACLDFSSCIYTCTFTPSSQIKCSLDSAAEEDIVMLTSSGVSTVPPGSWWVLHQRCGPLPDLSCLVWPCLSSHHTPVRTADSVPLALFIFIQATFHPADAFSHRPNPPLFSLRGTAVLVLFVFCICFLLACVMYLYVTREQVRLQQRLLAWFTFSSISQHLGTLSLSALTPECRTPATPDNYCLQFCLQRSVPPMSCSSQFLSPSVSLAASPFRSAPFSAFS